MRAARRDEDFVEGTLLHLIFFSGWVCKTPGFWTLVQQLAEMSSLFRPVHSLEIGPETIVGGARLVAYRMVWAKD